MSIQYHREELAIALDPSNPARLLPPIDPTRHKQILDLGCGMGQSLIAAQLPADINAFGVDCDLEALQEGRRIVPANINLLCATGEQLPFQDACFDFVFSRVALPLMHILRALGEVSRVLKAGGELWFSLHPASMVFSRAVSAARRGRLKDFAFCGYILLNGALFNYCGIQMTLAGRWETFQTIGGMARAMKRAGLQSIPVKPSKHFLVVRGRKPTPAAEGSAQ